MQDRLQDSNLKAMFAVKNIPSDSALRQTLDNVSTEAILPAFPSLLQRLQRGKQLDAYKLESGHHLIALDGSQYFSSEKNPLPQLPDLQRGKKINPVLAPDPSGRYAQPSHAPSHSPGPGTRGQYRRHHQAGLRDQCGKTDRRQNPPYSPEAEDGHYRRWALLQTALYRWVKDARMSFILVAKPTDHQLLFQWVDEIDGLGQSGRLQFSDDKGRRHVYRWVNHVPLNGSRNADPVNFFEYWLHVGQKVTYHNSWVTDLDVSKANVVELVKAGRARWKIENETFNTLKNQGYHIEHNFGHGQRYLSNTFLVLNLWPFSSIKSWSCAIVAISIADPNSVLAKSIGTTCVRYSLMLFRDFEHLLRNVADPPEIRAP